MARSTSSWLLAYDDWVLRSASPPTWSLTQCDGTANRQPQQSHRLASAVWRQPYMQTFIRARKAAVNVPC
jgi:hypothetical protein